MMIVVDVILKLKELLDTDVALMDNEEYSNLVDELGTSNKSQIKFINYVLSHKNLSAEDEYKIFMLLDEIYVLAKYEENYDVNELKKFYKWVLKIMFKKEFYNYSLCYVFSSLLVKMSKDIKQVFQDIIENMDIYNPLSIQIGICSMYYHYDFFQYKGLTEIFFNKILMSIDNNENNQGIIKDFNRFVKKALEIDEYKEYEIKFKPYFIDTKQ